MKSDALCNVDSHRQRIGAVVVGPGVAYFVRLPPVADEGWARVEEYRDRPRELRELKASIAYDIRGGFPAYGRQVPDDPPTSANQPVTSWWWPVPGDAGEGNPEPSWARMWMTRAAFDAGGDDDWLLYWCPRHGGLCLTAPLAKEAIRSGGSVLVTEVIEQRRL